MKKITVVLPLYELSSDIKRAVLSVKRQSISDDTELKIIDLRKYKAPKNFDKNKNGNIPPYVTTDKKAAKSKDIAAYLGDVGFDFEIISDAKKMPYQLFNEAIKGVCGEYLLFLGQNCVLTKDILEILYNRAVDKNADVLIGNSAKQKGKRIEKSQTTDRLFNDDEIANFDCEPSLIVDDPSIYNKFIKSQIIKSSGAAFAKYNAPKNIEFLAKIFINSHNIFAINREIYLCDFKRFYEYAYKRNDKYWIAYADSLLSTIKAFEFSDDDEFLTQIIVKYTEPLFKAAQKSLNNDLRGECVEIYKVLSSFDVQVKAVNALAAKYPISKHKNYKKFRVFLSKTKRKLTNF